MVTGFLVVEVDFADVELWVVTVNGGGIVGGDPPKRVNQSNLFTRTASVSLPKFCFPVSWLGFRQIRPVNDVRNKTPQYILVGILQGNKGDRSFQLISDYRLYLVPYCIVDIGNKDDVELRIIVHCWERTIDER